MSAWKSIDQSELEANSCSQQWARENPTDQQNSKQIHVLCAKCGKDQWTNQNSKHIHAPCTKRMLPRYDWFWFSFWLGKKLLHKVLANHKRGIANQSYLHGPTSRLTVWANGKKDSGLVNFILKSCLLFAQICSFYRKTAAKVWNWYQRWALTNRTPTHPIGLPSVSLPPEIFHWNDSKIRFPFTPWIYFSIGFPRGVW